MSLCFVCDAKLKGKCTQMSTAITPYSNVPYLEKICELVGEEFVIIANSTDHMCMKCTSFFVRMDKLENEVKLVKNAILTLILTKYGISPPDQAVKSIENDKMLNENLMTDEPPNSGQLELPNGLPVRKIPTVIFAPDKTPTQILKIQPQQNQKPVSGQLKLPNGLPVRKIPTVIFAPDKTPTQILKIQPQQNQKPDSDQLELPNGLPVRKIPTVIFAPDKTPIPILKIQPQQNQKPDSGQLELPNGLPVRKIPTVIFAPDKTPIPILKIQPQQNQKPVSGQLELQNGLPVRKIPTVIFAPDKTPIKILKIQPQQNQKSQQFQKQQDDANRIKILKCSTNVQLQKPTHLNQKQSEKPIVTQTAAAKTLTPVPQKKKLNFRCQVCSKCYDSHSLCLEHIKEDHMKLATSIANREREIEYSCPDTVIISKFHLTSQKKNQKVESPMDIDNNQQDNKKDTDQEKETDNFLETKTVEEFTCIKNYGAVKEVEEEEKNKEHAANLEKSQSSNLY